MAIPAVSKIGAQEVEGDPTPVGGSLGSDQVHLQISAVTAELVGVCRSTDLACALHSDSDIAAVSARQDEQQND